MKWKVLFEVLLAEKRTVGSFGPSAKHLWWPLEVRPELHIHPRGLRMRPVLAQDHGRS